MADIDEGIGDLTNSVVDQTTGDELATVILSYPNLTQQQRKETIPWRFNWQNEVNDPKREVLALLVVGPLSFERLTSIEVASGYVLVHLLESASHNVRRAVEAHRKKHDAIEEERAALAFLKKRRKEGALVKNTRCETRD